ncbi:tonB-system energizer ExbB [Jiella sonneratiae]|uniref:Biopolymer transport protein ExbB n=1 Tax=Jiella sonneratiae TaxID=2816856 RepID=A0ABS3J7E6_9HYPH|nr:tonB-system energizer ExbB [Jiella sonneratiae]MBO0905032.1 tonB-system energizer ExbB [Jiella sonneratiae]
MRIVSISPLLRAALLVAAASFVQDGVALAQQPAPTAGTAGTADGTAPKPAATDDTPSRGDAAPAAASDAAGDTGSAGTTGRVVPGPDQGAGAAAGAGQVSPSAADARTTTPSVDGSAPAGSGTPAAGTQDAAPATAETPGTGGTAENQSAEGQAAEFREPRDEKLPHDLSPLGMFLAADWVVKGVMIALGLASLATWTILVVKGLEVSSAKWRARRGVRRLARADSLGDAIGDERSGAKWRGPVGALARAAAFEWRRSTGLSAEGVKERVAIALARIEANAGRSLNRGTGLLATIGSIAPFVGLFGTVWGIMNAFIGISEANTTNLAVVAPGIAEALLATAIGLVAAIPAVIVYNVFARAIAGYRGILSDGSALVMQHLSRDLERRQAEAEPLPFARAAE